MKTMTTSAVFVFIFLILLSSFAAAEISFRDTIARGQAKLYQSGAQGYSLELVWSDTDLRSEEHTSELQSH